MLAGVSMLGCSSEPEAPASQPRTVAVTTELGTRWEQLSHRLSLLELAFAADPDELGGTVRGQNEGGPFGAIDTAFARYAWTTHAGRSLRSGVASVEVEIPATGATDPEAFAASGEARLDGAQLDGAGALVAWIRGYRISTDEYVDAPSFAYDPADGFTTQGVAILLGDPARDGGDVVVPVSVRNSLGPSDRADMNAAIPEASSWLRVDVVVVGAVGTPSAVSSAEVAYTLGAPDYGQGTVVPHAADDLQAVEVQGVPGLASGILGLKSFEIWLNAPGQIDSGCVVVQDPLNYQGEPVSGPGRYLTELSMRLWDVRYLQPEGRAEARVDVYFSNSSTLKEVGNVCLGLKGSVSLLQVDEAIDSRQIPPREWELAPGGPSEQAVRFAGQNDG